MPSIELVADMVASYVSAFHAMFTWPLPIPKEDLTLHSRTRFQRDAGAYSPLLQISFKIIFRKLEINFYTAL